MNTHRQHGWYCDARPDGSWVSLVTDSHLDTHAGRVEIPGENVLQFRLARDGRIAGHGHWSGQTQLWQDGVWWQTGPVISQDGHAWDEQDRLLACRRVATDAPDPTLTKLWDRTEHDGSITELRLDTGSIGIRDILPDGTIIPAWKSYADPARGLWGYTDFGDVAFGQGKDSGFNVRFANDGVLRRIEPGQCMFNRVSRDGDRWSIAIWRQDTNESIFYWYTTEELRMLDPVPVELPAINRKIDVGYFYRDTSAIQYGGDNADAPATVSVVIDSLGLMPEPFAGQPVKVIIDAGCLFEMARHPGWWDSWVGTYVASEGDVKLLEKMASSVVRLSTDLGLPWRPILSYTANALYPNALTANDIIGVQCYANKDGEEPDAVYARLRPWLVSVSHRRIALICQAYDRANAYWTGTRLAEMQLVWWRLACEFSNVEYLLLFSDGRKGGTRDHVEMRPWHTEMVRQATR